MKGSLRTVQNLDYSQTNFNDWCDPKCKPLNTLAQSKTTDKEHLDKTELVEEHKLSISSQTSVEIEELREKIKKGYPIFDKKYIREIKLSFYERLLLNLKEDGFVASYLYIKDLNELDEWQREKEKDFSIKNRPFLKSNIATLNTLCHGLIKAEVAKREGNKTQEMRALLNMAVHFSNVDDESWHWLAEELFEQCVYIDPKDHTPATDNCLEAIAKHMYAAFLLNVLHDLINAKIYVEESMQLSVGKMWKTSDITGTNNEILYFESGLLLHKIFLEMAHEKRDFDTEDAIKMYRNSLNWAKQVDSKPAEITALLNLTSLYIASYQLSPVLGLLENYIKLCIEENDMEGLCEGYILMAKYHELTYEDSLVIECMQNLLKVAEENKIIKMLALAHHKLATFYLMHRKAQEMQQHAIKSHSYYVVLNSKLEIEETKCLIGIAQAHEIMSQYLNILVKVEHMDSAEFKILMLWKTLHIPFFCNVNLFQPEGEINSKLKDRMETKKNDEFLHGTKKLQTQMASTITKQRSTFSMKQIVSTSSIAPRMSLSVLNFRRQFETFNSQNPRSTSKL